jgi:hypothetical protein
MMYAKMLMIFWLRADIVESIILTVRRQQSDEQFENLKIYI